MGQSVSVAAQCLLSAQQNQLASGQHPAGHSVSVTGSQWVLTILVRTAFTFFTAGQSFAVAAQYLLSGQQNQLASGQHPAGHSVSSGPQSPLIGFTRLNGSNLGNQVKGTRIESTLRNRCP